MVDYVRQAKPAGGRVVASILVGLALSAGLLSIVAAPSQAESNPQESTVAASNTAAVPDLVVTTNDDVVNGDVSSPTALVADPGPDGISLREAILAADNGGGNQLITFSPSLEGEAIYPLNTYNVNQPGITIQGPLDGLGQPTVTIDGGSESNAFLFGVQASNFALSGLRMAGILAGAAISVDAGESYTPQFIDDVSIEDSVFDNTSSPSSSVNAIYLSMPSSAVGAEISDVAVIGNSFDGLLNNSDGVLTAVGGTHDLIRNVEVEGNTFSDTTFPVEFVGANATDSEIEGARVVRNTFTSSLQPVNINQIGSDGAPATTGNVIDGTLVAQNTFIGDRGPDVVLLGGMTNATDNSITNTLIENNLMTGSTEYGGIDAVGGRQESSGNLVSGVQVVNDTITQNTGSGVGAQDNLSGGTGNTVTGVSVLNSIFTGNTADFDGLRNSQVSFSLTGQSGFAGANGDISGDPLFVDPSGGDFHLQSGSPAIGAGTSTGAPSTDLECLLRSEPPDMGAFEYGGTPTTCPPPSTTIDSHPAAATQLPTAEFSFESDTASSTFECSLDSGSFAACTSPADYAGLAGGSHVFQVMAIDPGGDWSPPAIFSWAVDITTTPTITNIPIGAAYGSNFTAVVATTGDGAISLASSSPNVCTVAGLLVSYVGAGTCSLTASVGLGVNYSAATGTAQTFSVSQAVPSTPTITNIPNGANFGSHFTAVVSTTGDGAKSVSSNSPSVCSVSSLGVNFVGVGTCSITASVGLGVNYQAATGIAQTFTVSPEAQAALTVTSLSGTVGTALQLTASGGSGSGAVSFVATNGTATGCTVSSGTLKATSAGTCRVTAAKAASAHYAAISSAPTSVNFVLLHRLVTVTVSFGSRSSTLNSTAKKALASFAKKVRAGSTVTITSYAKKNALLAKARAAAIKNYLRSLVKVTVKIKIVTTISANRGTVLT